jgi:hypothetical protein
MAKPKPEGKPGPAKPATIRILPMELQLGDRLGDETGEWKVVGRPCVRVQRVGEPAVTDLRTWGAHEKVSVKRTTAQEGKR